MIDATVRMFGNGHTVQLTNTFSELMRQPRGGGWGMAPVINTWFEGAGDGARLRGTRRTQRTLSIPVKAIGSTRQEVEDQVRRLVAAIRDPFRVYVDFADGRSYYVDAAYDAGAEGSYGPNPNVMTDLPLSLKADPYWTSQQFQSFLIAPGASSDPFLPELAGLHVGSSAAFGEVTILNVGDVPSKPTWTIHGPGTNPSVVFGQMGFTLERELTETDIITVAFEDGLWRVTDQNGDNVYADLAPAPWFPEFPPGASIVQVSMADVTSASYIRGIYPEMREVVY